MFEMRITGVDEAIRKLDDLSSRVQNSDRREVPIGEILTPSFLSACSRFSSVGEMLAASGYTIRSNADLAAIPARDLDAFVRSNTTFNSWQEMLQAAGSQWARRELGF